MANAIWRNVATYSCPSFRGETRRHNADARIASRQAVPDALSQLNVNTAAYGGGLAVTGGTRVITLCRPGTFRPFSTVALFIERSGSMLCVHASIRDLIDGSPHASTKTTSSR